MQLSAVLFISNC